jgi:hypothetical protein
MIRTSAAPVSHSIDLHQSELVLFRVIRTLVYLIESFKFLDFVGNIQYSRTLMP